MDRQSLLAFLLIGLIIVFYPWYMSIVAPPSLEDQKDLTEQSQYLNEPTNNKVVTPQVYDKNVGPQKLINVTTNLYSLDISNKNGGSFSKYQLFRFLDYDGQLVDLISDDNKNNLALSFVSIDGDEVVLDGNWNLKESVSSLRAERTQKTLTFSTTYLDQEITKTYTFYPDSYSIGLDVSFTNPSEFISRNQYSLSWSGGLPPTEKNVKNDYMFFEGYASLGGERMGSKPKKGKPITETQKGSTLWSAVKTKYFIAAIVPAEPGIGATITSELVGKKPVYNTDLLLSTNSTNSFTSYIGPLDYESLRSFNVGLEKNVDLGWALFRPIGQIISWLLTKLHNVIPNYGLVVILFAVLIKLLLNPLTVKTFESTRKMQELAPKIQKLKDKYKNDPQKMSRAQMELYRNAGANPMGGCLPMLIQMPILVSVFSIFRSKIEFRGAPFFGWISDLSVPDTLFEVAGFPINVLPVLMGSTMFVQQKMMAAPNADVNQKTMMYVMNVFFLFLFYSFPSGLNLYYFVFNLLSIIQQKYFMPKPVAAAVGSQKK